MFTLNVSVIPEHSQIYCFLVTEQFSKSYIYQSYLILFNTVTCSHKNNLEMFIWEVSMISGSKSDRLFSCHGSKYIRPYKTHFICVLRHTLNNDGSFQEWYFKQGRLFEWKHGRKMFITVQLLTKHAVILSWNDVIFTIKTFF